MAKKMKKKRAKKIVKAKAKSKAARKAKAKPKAKPKTKAKAKKPASKKAPVFKSVSRAMLSAAHSSKSAEEKTISASETQKFREILIQKQDELSEIVHRKKEEQEFQQEDPEIGDEADIATRSVEKEILFDITDAEKQTLDRIEAALRKIEKGVYGRCESCQKTIPRLRLEVMPWARYCIQCQSRNEVPPTAE
jgi:DnaK suppressor protein